MAGAADEVLMEEIKEYKVSQFFDFDYMTIPNEITSYS